MLSLSALPETRATSSLSVSGCLAACALANDTEPPSRIRIMKNRLRGNGMFSPGRSRYDSNAVEIPNRLERHALEPERYLSYWTGIWGKGHSKRLRLDWLRRML